MKVRSLAKRISMLTLTIILMAACGTTPGTTPAPITSVESDYLQCGDEPVINTEPSVSPAYEDFFDPDVVYQSTININQEDYEAARSRWQASNIVEYEIVLESGSMSHEVIGLNVLEDEVRFLGYYDSDGLFAIDAYRAEGLKRHYINSTVEGLFRHVDSILTDVMCPPKGEMGYEYKVAFDPTLGYPISIVGIGIEPREWQEQKIFSNMAAYSSFSTNILNFAPVKHISSLSLQP